MHPTFVLCKKSLTLFFTKKSAVLITFLVPIAMIYLFGQVFGLNKTESGPAGIPLALINQSPSPAAARLVEALQAEKTFRLITETKGADGTTRPVTEADARAAIHDNNYHFALILPPDLISDESFGLHLRLLSDPRNEIEDQIVSGMLLKTLFTKVPELLGQSLQRQASRSIGADRLEGFNQNIARLVAENFGGDSQEIFRRIEAGDFGLGSLSGGAVDATPPQAGADGTVSPAGTADAAGDVFDRILHIEREQLAGMQVANPMAARLVGGYAVMFLLFALTGSATSLFEEKRSGIFQRILSAPVQPRDILWGRFLFGIIVGVFQLLVMFLAGKFLYRLELAAHILPLLVLSLAAAAACTSFGMLLAAISKTPEAANGLATLLVLTMSAIGGAWFPVSLMPAAMQTVSHFTIVYWAVEGFTNIFWAGQNLREVLPNILVLTGTAVVIMLIATWSFRRNKMFE